VSAKNGYAQLHWTTGAELDSKGFNIQRKTGDGGTYQTIGFVASRSGGQNSPTGFDYYFTDPSALGNDVYYYRLQEVSVDDQYTYSDIKVLRGKQGGFEMVIYPNPAEGGNTTISLPQGNDTYLISLQDVNGRTRANWKKTGGGTLPVTGLTRGFYFVQAQNISTGEQKVYKLLVQ
jgi:hypothetical protein